MDCVDRAEVSRSLAGAQLDSIIAMMERLEHAKKCDGNIMHCSMDVKYPSTGHDTFREEYHDEDAALQLQVGTKSCSVLLCASVATWTTTDSPTAPS